MQVQLRSNVFTATQWFKPGDHPLVIFAGWHCGKRTYHMDVYDYEDQSIGPVYPGTWIVEMFDGIHLFDEEEFGRLFEPINANPTICKARTE